MSKQKGYWTKENVRKEALKYDRRSDFYKESSGAYDKACKAGWLDDICSHMKLQGNKYKRFIYAYEFEDNYVYVGLTYNINNRNVRHLNDKRSPVYKHIDKIKANYKLVQLTNDPIMIDKAKELEKFYLLKYKKEGWIVLNIAKTGALGGNILKWTKDECHKKALKFSKISQFKLEYGSAYVSARKNGWLDEITSHMEIRRMKPKDYWNSLSNVHKEALKYESRWEFKKKCRSGYTAAGKNKWLDVVCEHMKKKYRDWKFDDAHKEALKYKSKSEFRKNSSAAHSKAYRMNWLDDICSHM